MSLGVQTELRGNVTPAIEAALQKFEPAKVAEVISEPARIFWRDNLKAQGKNKMGWPSTGFWEDAARQTFAAVLPDGALLSCKKQGARLRWLGGAIKPVKKDALAIPISAVSYGHSPSEFPGLFLLRTKKGAWLVQAQSLETSGRKTAKAFKEESAALGGNKKAKRLRASLNFLFKLSKGVVQQGNPRVVPTADEFAEVSLGAIQKELLN